MTADEFVDRLRRAAPSAEQLQNLGFSPQEAAEFWLSFVCVPRPTRAGGSQAQADPLLDLLSRYDLGKVEIGMITFASDLGRDSDVWRVGTVEVDPLVQDRLTGEVRVTEGSPRGRVLWRCAQDGGGFLDALAPAAAFLGQCAHDSAVSENAALRRSKAQECSVAAGGSDYLDFYRMLLGCD
jgi:hypothetical protein